MPTSSAILQALSSQLPTHASKLPQPLISLCESLLARSRQRASHLKPEEEIARAYACCEIACKRLRSQCRLPAVKTGGAPCKPAVYKKLVAFLERVLDDEANAATPQKSATKKRTANGALKHNEVDESASEVPTPSRKSTGNTFVGKIKASKATNVELQGEAPQFVMPSIRRLCKTFSTSLLAPHVYTGTCVVLKLSGLWPGNDDNGEEDTSQNSRRGSNPDEVITGLVIALYLMTLTKMQTAKMTTTVYRSVCTRSAEVLGYTPGAAGVEDWIRTINRDQYCRGQDWWESVPDSVFEFDPENANGAQQEFDDDNDEELLSSKKKGQIPSSAYKKASDENSKTIDGQKDDLDGVLLPGLATMMQDAFDLVSDERQQEFDVWKKSFLRRLDRLDKQPVKATGGGKGIAAK